MKYQNIILFLFLITQINSVDVDVYTTEMVTRTTKTYKDIYGLKVECPNYGAMKNFKVIFDGTTKVGFEYICYSSKYAVTEYDESILKTATFKKTITKTSSDTTYAALGFEVLCPVDYAINSFTLIEGPGVLYLCVNTKPSSETKGLTVSTSKVASSNINQLTVGSVQAETETFKGAPLRGFQLVKDGSNFYFKYGYLTLKDVEKMKKEYLASSLKLREDNTQKL